MKLAVTLIALILALACLGSSVAQTPTFPKGNLSATFMKIEFPGGAGELAERFHRSVMQHREWWTDYVKKAAVRTPLPYHPNMGLTEKEYEQFLSMANRRSLKSVAQYDA